VSILGIVERMIDGSAMYSTIHFEATAACDLQMPNAFGPVFIASPYFDYFYRNRHQRKYDPWYRKKGFVICHFHEEKLRTKASRSNLHRMSNGRQIVGAIASGPVTAVLQPQPPPISSCPLL
jgi:hypothetical protein